MKPIEATLIQDGNNAVVRFSNEEEWEDFLKARGLTPFEEWEGTPELLDGVKTKKVLQFVIADGCIFEYFKRVSLV